jgi:hypothetical protein
MTCRDAQIDFGAAQRERRQILVPPPPPHAPPHWPPVQRSAPPPCQAGSRARVRTRRMAAAPHRAASVSPRPHLRGGPARATSAARACKAPARRGQPGHAAGHGKDLAPLAQTPIRGTPQQAGKQLARNRMRRAAPAALCCLAALLAAASAQQPEPPAPPAVCPRLRPASAPEESAAGSALQGAGAATCRETAGGRVGVVKRARRVDHRAEPCRRQGHT